MNVALCNGTLSVDSSGFINCDGTLTTALYEAPKKFSDIPSDTYGEAFIAGFAICLAVWAVGYGCRKIIEAINS